MVEETVGKEDGVRGLRIPVLFSVGLTVLFSVLLAGFLYFDIVNQRSNTEAAFLEEARSFAREMDAVWTFMDNSQYTINNESDGSYEFKGLHCAVVGKSVGAIFSKDNDYTIRYTNFNPRNSFDYPDEYEAEALTAFNDDRSVKEYYGIAEYNGEQKFRYLQALEVDETCLECHGAPVGELDVTGFPREGWTLDSVGGAISIIIPIDHSIEVEREKIILDTLLFFVTMLVIGAAVLYMIKRFIMRPVGDLLSGFNDMQNGDIGVSIEPRGAAREMRYVIRQFNNMSDELNVIYKSIENQVRERTADLERANEVLERQRDDLERLSVELANESKFKTDLLSMVNHELRTPLSAIITLAQISLGESREEPGQIQAWSEVEKNSRILLDMINDMLDIARTDANMVTANREIIDLGDIVASVRQSLMPLAVKYHVTLSTRISSDVPLVMGDNEKTGRIFNNLVSNAIKFTPDGGHVSVDVTYDDVSGRVICRVEDDGIGIAVEDQERIFDRFVQVEDATTRKYPGSGLGLVIVAEYAALQGYCIELESKLGQGSTFTVIVGPENVVNGDISVQGDVD